MVSGKELVAPQQICPGGQVAIMRTRHAPQVAREWLRDALTTYGVDRDAMETARLVVTELVTNAVLHASGRTVRVRWHPADGGLCLEVWDDSNKVPRMGDLDDVSAESKRGLAMLDLLVTTWNWQPRSPRGKVVWAIL